MLFPGQCVSLPIIERTNTTRPPHGSLPPAVVDEIVAAHDGKVAVLTDGLDVGCIADLSGPLSGVDRELLMPHAAPSSALEGDGLHLVGGAERVQLLETAERTAAGGRMAIFSQLIDEPLRTSEQKALEDEAVAAEALLEQHQRQSPQDGSENWSLELCTLDEESMGEILELIHPAAHPLFLERAVVPRDDPTALGYWLASRLPLTTAARAHLLRVTCPLKRMRDVVDALRLLTAPNNLAAADQQMGKFELLWQTAEASGCELEAPKCVLHWRGEGDAAVSRY